MGALQNLAGDRVMALEAIRGLAFYDHPDTPGRLSKSWGIYGPAERAEAINTLCARPAYARSLLDMLRAGRIAKSDVTAFHARQISGFDDPELNRQLAELWGEVRVTTAEKRSLIERFKSQFTPDVLAQAHPAAGRALFQKNCASCHVLFGAGRKVGPDLTGSNRKNLDYLLENVIDPSASVGSDFQTWVVILDDGRVLNGVITDQSEPHVDAANRAGTHHARPSNGGPNRAHPQLAHARWHAATTLRRTSARLALVPDVARPGASARLSNGRRAYNIAR